MFSFLAEFFMIKFQVYSLNLIQTGTILQQGNVVDLIKNVKS